MRRARRARSRSGVVSLLRSADATLLDLVDHVLTRGVVVHGEVMLGLADIDLVYLRLSALLCAADRVVDNAHGGRRRRRPSTA